MYAIGDDGVCQHRAGEIAKRTRKGKAPSIMRQAAPRKRLEPRIQTDTCVPVRGWPQDPRSPSSAIVEVPKQFPTSCGKLSSLHHCAAAGRPAAAMSVPGARHETRSDAARIERIEGCRLFGNDEKGRCAFGSMMPPGPTAAWIPFVLRHIDRSTTAVAPLGFPGMFGGAIGQLESEWYAEPLRRARAKVPRLFANGIGGGFFPLGRREVQEGRNGNKGLFHCSFS